MKYNIMKIDNIGNQRIYCNYGSKREIRIRVNCSNFLHTKRWTELICSYVLANRVR